MTALKSVAMQPDFGEQIQSYKLSQFGQPSFNIFMAVTGGLLCLSCLPIIGAIREHLIEEKAIYVAFDILFLVLFPLIGAYMLAKSGRDVADEMILFENGVVFHFRSGHALGHPYEDIANIEWKYYPRNNSLIWLKLHLTDGTREKVRSSFERSMEAVEQLRNKCQC